MVLKLQFSNKAFYIVLAVVVVIALTSISLAWNSNNPSVMGHTANEISGLSAGGSLQCRVISQSFPNAPHQGTVTCNADEVLTGGACRDNGGGTDIIVASIGTYMDGTSYTCKADQAIRISAVCCKGTITA